MKYKLQWKMAVFMMSDGNTDDECEGDDIDDEDDDDLEAYELRVDCVFDIITPGSVIALYSPTSGVVFLV